MKIKTKSWPHKLGLSLAFAFGLAASAHAAAIIGNITFDGGAQLDTATVNTATKVVSWVSPQVQSRDGDFLPVLVGTAVSITAPWNFNTGLVAPFWQVGGFTFNLTSSAIVVQTGGFLNVAGTGSITGNGYTPTAATWRFTAQDPSAGVPAVFSISASTGAQGQAVPDGGSSIALLGLALTGMAMVARKKKAI